MGATNTLTAQEENQIQSFDRMKIAKVLLELAEYHLDSSESNHLISKEGIERLRAKLQ